MTVDLSSDYLGVDGIETLTYTPQGTGATPVTGVQALRRALSIAQIAFGAAVPGIDVNSLVFNLWTSTLGGATPKNGDRLTDSDEVVYTIISASRLTMGTRWRVIANPSAVNSP